MNEPNDGFAGLFTFRALSSPTLPDPALFSAWVRVRASARACRGTPGRARCGGGVRQNGETPLFTAAMRGHAAIVAELLDCKADPALADKNGQTPLGRAVHNAQFACAALLVRHKADFAATQEVGADARDGAGRGGANAESNRNQRRLQGRTRASPRSSARVLTARTKERTHPYMRAVSE